MDTPVDDSLEMCLLECRNAARKGYEIAKDNLHSMNLDIGYMSNLLSRGLDSLNSSQIRTKEVGDQLRAQLSAIVAELRCSPKTRQV